MTRVALARFSRAPQPTSPGAAEGMNVLRIKAFAVLAVLTASLAPALVTAPAAGAAVLQKYISVGAKGLGVNITPAGSSASVRFSGLAGQTIVVSTTNGTFTTNCSLNVSLLSPSASVLAGPVCGGQSAALPATALAVDGDYTISLQPAVAATGTIKVAVALVSGPRSITPSAAAATGFRQTTANQVTTFGFLGTAGTGIAVNIAGGTFPTSCSLQVRLKSATGTTISGPACAGTSAFLDPVRLPATAVYQVELTSVGTVKGAGTVLVIAPIDLIAPIAVGGTTSRRLTYPGQNARLTFTGAVGQARSAVVSAVAFTGTVGSGCALTFLRPDGSVRSTADCAGGLLDQVLLDAAGTWTLLLDPNLDALGKATVSLLDATDQTRTVAVGATAAMSTTVAGSNGRFTFPGAIGDGRSVTVTAPTFSAPNCYSLVLLRPDGSTKATTGACATAATLAPQTLDVAGTWTVLVDPQGVAVGTATVGVAAVSTGLVPGIPAAFTIATAGQSARFAFAGTAGEARAITLSGLTGTLTGATCSLLRPDGSTLASTRCDGTGGFLDQTRLDVTGTWTVLLVPDITATGTALVSLVDATDQIGTITVGASASANLANPGQNARLTFSGVVGDGRTVSLSSPTFSAAGCYTLSLLRPDGSTKATANACATTTSFTTVADVSGTWTVLVDPQGLSVGRAGVDVVAGFPSLPVGVATAFSITTPGAVASFPVGGSAGMQRSLMVTGITGTLATACFRLSLVAPDSSVAASTIACGSSAFLDQQTYATNGQWTATLTPFGSVTGSGTITVVDATNQTGPIAVGGTVTATIAQPGQNARFTFAGTVGQQRAVTLSGLTGALTGATCSLLRPDGTTAASAWCDGVNGFLDQITIDVPGTWSVLIDPDRTATGTATVTLANATDQTGTIAVGGTAAVAITQPGQNARFTFAGTTGQLRSVTLSGFAGGLTTAMCSLVRPDGTVLDEAVCSGTGSFLDHVALDVTGTWTVLVDPATSTGTATVALVDATDQAGTIAIGGSASVTITRAGQNARFTFAGVSGTSRKVTVSAVGPGFTSSCFALSLLRPNATVLASTAVCANGTVLGPVTLDASGTWTVLVDPYGPATGTATLSLA